jgi:cell division inhibitor SepF
MPGVWKKALGYLGLVEEEGYDEMDEVEAEAPVRPEPVSVRSMERGGSSHPSLGHSEHIVRTIPQPRHASAMIHKSEPKRFNEARDLGDKFRDGVPVIMNLQGTDDTIARRLVDFASGLVFGLDGKIELVANRVYLLTPANMEVSAEEKARLQEGGFYNQF